MSNDNPYQPFVDAYASLLKAGADLPLGGFQASRPPSGDPARKKALIFSPHPDDECIIGGLALRLMRESGMQVVNVAVTLGRRPERKAGRWRELEDACAYLGFGLLLTVEGGLETVTLSSRESEPAPWADKVAVIAEILERERPDVVFMPHDADGHPAHIGTHHLVLDALAAMPPDYGCQVVETEFWGAMTTPNLMVESSPADLADLAAALSFHVGEVERNPYHLRLPAWMIDNVRRGAELVQGHGQAAPDMTFATLYRLRRWSEGGIEDALPGGRVLTAAADPGALVG